MKVVYADGTSGILAKNQVQKLHVSGRFTKEDWKDLELAMLVQDIVKFEDPVLSTLGSDMVTIEYVRNQIAAH